MTQPGIELLSLESFMIPDHNANRPENYIYIYIYIYIYKFHSMNGYATLPLNFPRFFLSE